MQPTTSHDPWPALPLAEWRDTYATLHRWLQMVGKTRLALAPMQNHWWQVVLYPTSRVLGTSAMPVGHRALELELHYLDHQLVARPSDGEVRAIPLVEGTVAELYSDYSSMLHELYRATRVRPIPVGL